VERAIMSIPISCSLPLGLFPRHWSFSWFLA
jgi:hypothetical protein